MAVLPLADPPSQHLAVLHLADPPSQHLAVQLNQHLADLTSLEGLQPSVKQGAVLVVLVNLHLVVLLSEKTKAALLAEDLDLLVVQVHRRLAQGLGSQLVGGQAKRRGLGLTRASSRHMLLHW